ncbi:DNA-formamidopyrimidine glycosylase family protein [Branchiibius sp. NY16-3462-2]|uniref:DNA-formamidopyrimidine glycosylase family protein n=1 Tax=Branchiibius sp. NY16-3462-2 TaxID=1807500 RepID=UPI0007942B37|nr:DNA-formamidopyrimidine glycosylase family protein [Branchiibius sp. NY16-3462-2]KYH45461.1 hypothetical protein AZH51_00655 [Branchiibius sp. NY16-3462-2]
MPEGDVVHKTADRLNAALAGAPLVGVDLRWPNVPDVELRGRDTVEVVARGKHLLHRIAGGVTLHTHLRMEGSWRIRPTEQVTPAVARRADIRAIVADEQWAAIGYRLGMLELLATADEDRVVGHLGPDILAADFDATRAVRNLRANGERTIGSALLDQRNVAGIGTMFAAESLFATRTPPWQGAADSDVEAILASARRMMLRSMQQPIRDVMEQVSTLEESAVHARNGRPCLRCGGTVRVAMIGDPPQERTMFYCPTCQGGLGPTDDGKRQNPLSSGPRSQR